MKQIEVFDSMNIDEFVDWLDKYGGFESSQWLKWWDETFCKNCDSETACIPTDEGGYGVECEYGYCELHGNCRYFQHMPDVPDNKQIIKMWLESEV